MPIRDLCSVSLTRAERQAVVDGGGFETETLRTILQPIVWFAVVEPQEKDRMKQGEGAYNVSDEGVRNSPPTCWV